jgi:hypothetical protein
MRLFIVGPRWVGEWTEGVGRAAGNLGHQVALFYYLNDDSFEGHGQEALASHPAKGAKGRS